MKKLFKRFTILSLCACMLIGTAVTSSAATYSSSPIHSYSHVTLYSKAYPSHRLNILTSSVVQNKTDVTTWSSGAIDDYQKFKVNQHPNGTVSLSCYLNAYSNFVVERYYGSDNMNNCDMYDKTSSYMYPEDYQFYVIFDNDGYGNLYHQFKTKDGAYAMSASTSMTAYGYNIYDVRWVTPSSTASNQRWLIG